jgi:hypothetical protein
MDDELVFMWGLAKLKTRDRNVIRSFILAPQFSVKYAGSGLNSLLESKNRIS